MSTGVSVCICLTLVSSVGLVIWTIGEPLDRKILRSAREAPDLLKNIVAHPSRYTSCMYLLRDSAMAADQPLDPECGSAVTALPSLSKAECDSAELSCHVTFGM